MEFWTHWEFCWYGRNFDLRKHREYLYRLFDVLPQQAECEMKPIQVRVYIQQRFHDRNANIEQIKIGRTYVCDLLHLVFLRGAPMVCSEEEKPNLISIWMINLLKTTQMRNLVEKRDW